VVVKKDGNKKRVHPSPGGPLLRRKLADDDVLVVDAHTLVPLPDRPIRQDIDIGVEGHRTRLQREGIFREQSDLDLPVAPPIKVKSPPRIRDAAKF